jgi:hypothetical protein
MAELRRVGHPGMAPLTAPFGAEKPVRIISRPDSSTTTTTLSEGEEREANARLAVEHETRIALNRAAFGPVNQECLAAERAEAALAKHAAAYPDGARAALRAAHAQRQALQAELEQHYEQAAVAEGYCAECRAAVEDRKLSKAIADDRAMTSIREIIEGGGRTAPTESEEADHALARATRALERAAQLCDRYTLGIRSTETRLRQIELVVEKAALAVVAEAVWVYRDRLHNAEETVKRLRKILAGLHIDTRYGAIHWPAPLRALLTNPEAALVEEEAVGEG